MVQKEEEARERWCPYRRGQVAKYSGSDHEELDSCIASGCMMWRTVQEVDVPTGLNSIVINEKTKQRTMIPDTVVIISGYCGLARRG